MKHSDDLSEIGRKSGGGALHKRRSPDGALPGRGADSGLMEPVRAPDPPLFRILQDSMAKKQDSMASPA